MLTPPPFSKHHLSGYSLLSIDIFPILSIGLHLPSFPFNDPASSSMTPQPSGIQTSWLSTFGMLWRDIPESKSNSPFSYTMDGKSRIARPPSLSSFLINIFWVPMWLYSGSMSVIVPTHRLQFNRDAVLQLKSLMERFWHLAIPRFNIRIKIIIRISSLF